ncbi:hypothetical protein EOD39_2998 [Acipenser ruthenus]|uniref:Uncharacterized protein n=1 Tax=Acipenser ruthenus TaxID=7906 RepID=A0A444TX00_ACIRT|nr:hypothetical protein EOD39_2998 [Acipenser ruthenus]
MDRNPWSIKEDTEEATVRGDTAALLGWVSAQETGLRGWLQEQITVAEEKKSRAGNSNTEIALATIPRSADGNASLTPAEHALPRVALTRTLILAESFNCSNKIS